MTQGIIVSPANRGVQVVVTDENNVQLLVDSNRGVNLEIVPQPRIEVLVDKGVEGAQGPVGPQGPQGPQGTAATVTAGTTTTGLAGTNAIVTNSGTSSAAVFDFTIPRGDTGATGATGAGVAVGGTTGQFLQKASNANYDTTWATITGTLVYQGSWNASTNTPTLTSSVGTNGYYYVVGTSGSTNLNGITDWVVGDWAIFNGSVWQKIDNTDLVSSVNGQTGVVVLGAADVGALSTITSTDGSIAITSPNATTRDLSVVIAGSTTNVVAQVRNTTGATLTKGTVVYITGATGQISTVSKALASSDATSAQTLGMMTADLSNNSNGFVTIIGLITNIDTSAYTDGQQLYLSGTVAGAVTATKPSAPIHIVYVAVVEYAHPTQGKLFVKVQNGYELDEIHDVSIVSPTTGQTLVYDSVTDLWSNSNAPTITGGTINNTTVGATTPSTGVFTTLTATGQTSLGGAAGSEGLRVLKTTSSVNFVQATGAVTGSNPAVIGQGGDTEVGLDLGIRTGGFNYIRQRIGSTGFIDFSLNAAGSPALKTNTTSGQVNYHQLTGSATGSGPIHSVAGSDTNIDLNLTTKGTGSFVVNTGNGTVFKATDNSVASIVNYTLATGSNSGGAPVFGVAGTDTNAGLNITSKGTGAVTLRTGSSAGSFSGSVAQFNVAHTASAVNYVQATGSATGQNVVISAQGSDSDVWATIQSKNSGGVVVKATGGFYAQNASGATQFLVSNTASAVNYVQVTGAVTGSTPYFLTSGSDTNIGLVLATKGSGSLSAWTNGGTTLQFRVADTPSAVNYLQVTGNATGGAPTISALGSDANVYLDLKSKGNLQISLYTGGGIQFAALHTASAVNYPTAKGSATGFGVVFGATGSDTNIDLNLTTKGTGAVNLRTNTGTQLKVVDATGTTVDNPWLVRGGQTFVSKSVLTSYAPKIQASDASAITFNTNAGSSGIEGGQQQFAISHTASAVNYVQVTGAATTNFPTLSAQGSDTNIGLTFASKGTQAVRFNTNTTDQQFRIAHTGGTSNYVQVTGSVTGSAPVLSSQGSDTNIPLVLQPKGTGALQAQQTDSTATGGNARGANAVDWQTSRGTAGQVASGQFSVVGGGYGNAAVSSYAAAVLSGYGNSTSGSYGVIAGGQNNSMSSGTIPTYSSIVGGYSNVANGYYNVIVGGVSNSGTSISAVTTQSGTMNGTTAVTLSGSNASIKVGQTVTGTSIATYTYVAAISGTSLTLSQAASGSSTSTLFFYTPHGVVVGGGNNQATGSYSFIGGGGDAGTAGNRNVASGDWSVVVGGQRNTASGNGSIIVGGGTGGANTASGPYSTIIGGQYHVSSGFGAVVTGVSSNTANSGYSTVLGSSRGTTRGILGNTVIPATAEPFSYSNGGVQAAILIVARQTTDATPTVLCSDASAAGTTNQVILPNNSAYYFKVEIIANVTGGGNTSGWELKGVIKRGANAASTAIVGSVTSTLIAQDAGASTWVVSATADTTNGGLKITVTGQASTTIRWVAKASTTEVTF